MKHMEIAVLTCIAAANTALMIKALLEILAVSNTRVFINNWNWFAALIFMGLAGIVIAVLAAGFIKKAKEENILCQSGKR